MKEFVSSLKTWVIGSIIIGIGALGTGAVSIIHNMVVMPMFHKVVDARVDTLVEIRMQHFIEDELLVILHEIKAANPAGTRTIIADTAHISKDRVVAILAALVMRYEKDLFDNKYQFGYNDVMLNLMMYKIDTLGTIVYDDGEDWWFRDTSGYVWEAFPKSQKFIFFPPSANNDKITCYPIPKK